MIRRAAAVAVIILTFAVATPAEAHQARPGSSSRSRAAGQVNGYPCGGTLPPCYVLWRESRGNPTAQNRRSTASGLWQALDGTWNGFGGYRKARHAPVDVQNAFARKLWAGGRGCRAWNACGR